MERMASRVATAFLALFCLLFLGEAGSFAAAVENDNPAARANARATSKGVPRTASKLSHGGPLAPSAVYTGSPLLAPGAVIVNEHKSDTAANDTISDSLDDYDDHPVATIADPIEPWNRFWFKFNDIFYIHVADPVYRGWKYVTPQFVRTGLSNIFHNMFFPTRFVNSLLQFRFMEAGVEFSRFMMNMMGSAGMVDLASGKKTIVPVDPSGEDFGQTLGRWGIGQGFYIVWPFIGPSSLRDSVGRAGDLFTDPLFYVSSWELAWGTALTLHFNDLGDVLPSYIDLRSISVDPYIAMREAYVSLREAQVKR